MGRITFHTRCDKCSPQPFSRTTPRVAIAWLNNSQRQAYTPTINEKIFSSSSAKLETWILY